ncbi:MAG: hypothetical protein V7711_15580 [Pseudomonadales bacterium]
MNILLSIHLLAIGIWIGVVAAEFAIEFDGLKDSPSLIKASKLHYLTDIWVEIPAFVVVFVTGAFMITEKHLAGLFLYKVIFGVLAIIFNGVCVYAVFKRKGYAVSGDIDGMISTDPAMRLGGAGFIPSFLVAFGIGIYFMVK